MTGKVESRQPNAVLKKKKERKKNSNIRQLFSAVTGAAQHGVEKHPWVWGWVHTMSFFFLV